MLKRILTKKKYFKNIYREQKGITGLETAIILIAFVVVAAVFAYTVLSAGLFSTQKSQQAVYSGLQESQSTIEVKGGVVSNGVAQLDNMDSQATWSKDHANALADEATIKVEGSNSMRIDVSTANNNTLAHKAMVAKSWSTTDTVTFWAKFAESGLNGKVKFTINTLGNATTLQNAAMDPVTLDTTAALNPHAADTNWHKYSMTITGAHPTAVEYGFYTTSDLTSGYTYLYVDDIEITDANMYSISDPMTTFANSAVFTLSLAAGGNPVDFTTDTDVDVNGIFEAGGSKDGTLTHKVIINYSDSTQQVNDLAWTLTKLGSDDNDNLLSGNEKYQLTVDLTYINQHASTGNKIIANHAFTLEVKPPTGAVLTISRTMPAKIQTINNLN